MKALYIGPVQTIPNYSLYTSQAVSTATIPYENSSVQVMTELAQFIKGHISADAPNPDSDFSSGTGNPKGFVKGSGDETSFAISLLTALAVPATDSNKSAVVAWERAEGGLVHNNPLNTTENMPGATNWNSTGVKTYVSIEQGLQATVKTITNGLYGAILSALKDGKSACAVANAVMTSPWGTSSLIKEILGC
jgi:hypothetical protein